MENKEISYLFSSTPPLLAQHVISETSIPEDLPKGTFRTLIEDDSDLLPHSDMSWEAVEDRYVLYEILSENSSTTSSISSSSSSTNLSFSLLDQAPISVDQDAVQCVNDSKWSSYALDINLWNDDRAPVVTLRNVKEMLFDELEFCGVFTDRLIGAGKSFLTKSPENNCYILSKCVMRSMALTNIAILYQHHYLQYVDLAYNFITSLAPLGGIPYLMFLNVAHNRLTTVLSFSPPWYLTYVNLSYNYITEMCDISDFWSLIHLDLSHNAIEEISGLHNLKYLKYLNLSYNLIECIENVDKLNIQELNLEGNCIMSFKSNIPGYGINCISELRKLYLGYNKLSTLEFFKDSYSLRVIDLKFNKINDLMELSNFKGLIQEIDFRGNGCTKWPNYRAVLLYSIPSIRVIDGNSIPTSEKVAAVTLFASPVNLTAARTITKLTLLEQLNIPKIEFYVMPYDEMSPPLVILTGPSAVKKLCLALEAAHSLPKKVKYCKWHTTKMLLESEPHTYINREDFNEMSRHGEFLAIQEKLGNSYGLHRDEISSLILERKIGITNMDLHATIQMSKRYSNSKPVLVITKNEDIHRMWIKENFDVYTCTKDEKSSQKDSTINLIKRILYDIIDNMDTCKNDISEKQQNDTVTNVILESDTFLNVTDEAKMHHIKFQNETDDIHPEGFHPALEEHNKGLRVILDEFSNIVVEDKHEKRKRHQAKILQRRDTLLQESNLELAGEISESDSSDEILQEKSADVPLKPEDMKELYADLILRSRKTYLDHHMNKPGFFSLVLLTDDYQKAYTKLLAFAYKLYTSHSTENSKFSTELTHFRKVAMPAMIDTVVDEIRESLSSSVEQKKRLLRTSGITSWKDLMPEQMMIDPMHIKEEM